MTRWGKTGSETVNSINPLLGDEPCLVTTVKVVESCDFTGSDVITCDKSAESELLKPRPSRPHVEWWYDP